MIYRAMVVMESYRRIWIFFTAIGDYAYLSNVRVKYFGEQVFLMIV